MIRLNEKQIGDKISFINNYINAENAATASTMDANANVDRLTELLVIAKSFNLKTAMYTGLDVLEPELVNLLDYYKLGKYDKQLGGLSSTTTNQRLYKVIQPNAIHQYNFQSKQWNIVHT